MQQNLRKKANFDLAGLPLDEIYSESPQISKMQMKEKLQHLNKLFCQQKERILNFDKDILLDHDKEHIFESNEKRESQVDEGQKPIKKSHSSMSKVESQSSSIQSMTKPLRTEQNYAEKLQIYNEQSDSKTEKNYWDYFKQFTRENTTLQRFDKNDFPIYIPTQEDKEDAYMNSVLDQVDLSSLDNLLVKRTYSILIEDLQTNEKYIHQYMLNQVKKIVKQGEKEDFYFLITSQFFQFNEENYKYELNNNQRILHDVLTINDTNNFSQQSCLNQGTRIYHFKKTINLENKLEKVFKLHFQDIRKSQSGFNNETECKRISRLEKYDISLPQNDFDFELQDLEYQFLTDARPGIEPNSMLLQKDLLDKQFILVQTFKTSQVILIYSLKNPLQPILRFQEAEFQHIKFGYFTIVNPQKIIFTLRAGRLVYYVEYNPESKVVIQKPNVGWGSILSIVKNKEAQEKGEQNKIAPYKIEDDSRIKIQPVSSNTIVKNKRLVPITLEIKLDEKKDNTFEQTFMRIYNSCSMDLIYPIQPCVEGNNIKQKVIDYIKKYYNHDENDKNLTEIYYNNARDIQRTYPEFKNFMKKEYNIVPNWHNFNIITQDTMFFQYTQGDEHFKILTLKNPRKIFSRFENIRNEIKEDSNYYLLDKVMNNFDWKLNQKIYQDNQLYNKSKGVERGYSKNNDYLENYYINKRKQDVYTTHCNAFINEQFFSFQEQYLLIDLDEKSKDPFNLIKLYGDEVKELKLVKYHKSQNCVIFFFLFRSRIFIENDQEVVKDEMKGVHFFVFRSIQQLKSINNGQTLINNETDIYVQLEINNIIKDKYALRNLLKYVSNEKRNISTSTFLIFEYLKDFGDPIEDWMPYLYQNWISNQQYETYFCFFNVEYLATKSQYQIQNEEEDRIDFSECIQVFKLDFFQSINERLDIKQNTNTYRNQIKTMQICASRMFQRCSNWQRNLFTSNSEQFSAKFAIGEILEFQNLMIELREYLVTFDMKKKIFINREQNILGKDNFSSNISMMMCQLKTINISRFYYKEKFKFSWTLPFENFVLLPKISRNGNINGIYLMINYNAVALGIYKFSGDEEVLKKEHPDIFHKLQPNMNKYFFCSAYDGSKKTIYGHFGEGEEFKDLKISAISQDYYKKIVEIEGQDQYKSFEDALSSYKPYRFLYDIIELENQVKYQNEYHYLQGQLFTMGFKQIHFDPSKQEMNMVVMNVILHRDCIQNQYFDKFDSTRILYENLKYLLTASLPNFLDFQFELKNKHNFQFFQPKFILKGQSLCSLALNSVKPMFDKFKEAIETQIQEKDYYHIIYNSIMFHSQKDRIQKCVKNFVPEKTINIFQLNIYYGLMHDFLNYETILQKAISNNRAKEAQYLIEYLSKASDPYGTNWYALMQDLPQILCSTKYNINMFFNQYQEDEIDDQCAHEEIIPCRFERQLCHQDLPQFGDENPKIIFLQDLNGAFVNDNEVQNLIILHDQQEVKVVDDSKIQVQVQHSFISFDPVVRKIKIDKILNRESDENIYTDYLDLFDQEPQKITHMNHLFISNLIDRNSDTDQFMEQSSVRLMIDFQYDIAKPVVKQLLIFYVIGFYLPFIYASFMISNFDYSVESQSQINIIYLMFALSFITLTIFMIFEYAEIKFNGIEDYFSDSWNYFDSTQYIFFIINVFLSKNLINQQSFGIYSLVNEVLQIMILLLATTRILQYIRYKESFSFLVQMLMAVIFDLSPFLTIFLIFVIVFTFVIVIMQADIDPEDYEGIPKFMRIMIQVFRNSIGDIAIVQYGKWGEESSDPINQDYERARPFAKFIIWLFWFFNLFFMLIIMLNFLIAEVSQTYDKVKSQGMVLIYRQKASLNKLVFQIQHLFGIKHEFRVVAIEQPPLDGSADDEFSTFSVRIKKNTAEQLQKLRSFLMNFIHQNIDRSTEITTKALEHFIQLSFKDQQQKNLEQEQRLKSNLENLEKQIEKMDKNIVSIKVEHNDLVKNFEIQLEKILSEDE